MTRVVEVVGFLVGLSLLASAAGRAGLFVSAAASFSRLAGDRPRLLLAEVGLLAVATTVLLGLDTCVVLVTPLALALARSRGVSSRAFALLVVWCAGTANLLLPVSNLTNLLASEQLGRRGLQFAQLTWRPSVAALTGTALAGLLLARRLPSRAPLLTVEAVVPADRGTLRAAACAVVGLIVLVSLEVTPVLAVALVSLPLAMLVALREGHARVVRELPWPLIALTGAVLSGVTLAAQTLEVGARLSALDPYQLGIVSAVAGNLIDNLPAYLLLQDVVGPDRLIAVLIGTGVGTFVLPWGSLATLLWAAACRQAGEQVPWRVYVPLSLPLAVGVLGLSLAVR